MKAWKYYTSEQRLAALWSLEHQMEFSFDGLSPASLLKLCLIKDYLKEKMSSKTITNKGYATIPKKIDQQLENLKNSQTQVNQLVKVPSSGFGMLKSPCSSIPADFDPASLLAMDTDG